MITLQKVSKNKYIIELLKASDKQIAALGFTEHGLRHADVCAKVATEICVGLGFSYWEKEVAICASYLHDIGNLAGRFDHGQIGSVIVHPILMDLGAEPTELARIVTAIACHDDVPPVISTVTTAVCILADKSDVNRTRVRPSAIIESDIHDRVNYSVLESILQIYKDTITLKLTLDPRIADTADYLEIFAERMQAMRKSAKFLSCQFRFLINDVRIF